MGCLLRWKAGETRSPPRYVPASNCGAEEVMARTRAPWTSQNAPRMHLQSLRAVLAERVLGLKRLQSRTQWDTAGQSARVASAVTWLSEEREKEVVLFRWRVIPSRGHPCGANFALPQHLLASSMATATARRCGSCASRHTCTLASAVAYRREVPSVPPAKTVFKRKLPSGLVPFSSPAGRSFFMQAPAARSRLLCLAPRRSPASHRLPPPPLRRRCRATRWSHSSRCRSSSLHRRSRRTARWAR